MTRLEEVDIEAEAEDDFGIERLELVYAVRGGAEKVVPLRSRRRATSVTGRHTLYLEDLDVQPGDFVSYYVRARDVARGKRPSEARSDIFFLEVKPFEQEFALAQSQGDGAARRQQPADRRSGHRAEGDHRRHLEARSARRKPPTARKSEQDIRAVARPRAELKTRVEADLQLVPRVDDARSAAAAAARPRPAAAAGAPAPARRCPRKTP